MDRLKLDELSSGIGALVLGVGLGALAADAIGSLALPLLVVGIALHAIGMADKHRLERLSSIAAPRWVTALYWTCWVLLGGLALWLAAGNR